MPVTIGNETWLTDEEAAARKHQVLQTYRNNRSQGREPRGKLIGGRLFHNQAVLDQWDEYMPLREQLVRKIEQLGYSHRTLLPGWRADLRDCLEWLVEHGYRPMDAETRAARLEEVATR